jgi:hypothetical protein
LRKQQYDYKKAFAMKSAGALRHRQRPYDAKRSVTAALTREKEKPHFKRAANHLFDTLRYDPILFKIFQNKLYN